MSFVGQGMFFQICNLLLFIVKCSSKQKEEKQKKKQGFPWRYQGWKRSWQARTTFILASSSGGHYAPLVRSPRHTA